MEYSYCDDLVIFVDSFNIPLAPNHWQGAVYLNWNTDPVKQRRPEKSEPGAVFRFLINTEKAVIDQKYSTLGKKECRANNQVTGEAMLFCSSQPSPCGLRNNIP